MQTITGKCHCGNIAYRFEWPAPGMEIPVRACSCTFCTKHGGVYTSHPDGRLEARVADPSQLSRYVFGTRTAEFYVCRACGAVPFVTSTIDGIRYAVVNANTFENVDRAHLRTALADFDGESTDDRLARRKRNWIAQVSVQGET